MSPLSSSRHLVRWSLVAVVLVIAGGAVAVASHRASAGGHPKSHGHSTHTISATSTTTTTTTLPPPIDLTSFSPTDGDKLVPPTTDISISFSATVDKSSSLPVLSPALSGSWSGLGTSTLTFAPSERLDPYELVKVTIPAGSSGITGSDGATLTSAVSEQFTVAGASTLRLQQLLAELGYLPVAFEPAATTSSSTTTSTTTSTAANVTTTTTAPIGATPTTTTTTTIPVSTTTALDAEPASESAISLDALPGSFVWRFSDIPSQLAATWQSGEWNEATRGAVMAFESEHGLGVDGEPGNKVWTALLHAVAARDATTRPYDYLIATESDPETLYVWRNGTVIYSSLANTGIVGATTQLGTFAVYLRFLSATMSGTNPNGKKYVDPGVPYISYFNGSDAVHGFPRAEYGYPQSVGCIELPISDASVVWPMDPYGTLVTVTTGSLAAELGVKTVPAGSTTPPPTTSTTTTTPKPPTSTSTTSTSTTSTSTTSTSTTSTSTTSTTSTTTTSTTTTTVAPTTTTTTAPPS